MNETEPTSAQVQDVSAVTQYSAENDGPSLITHQEVIGWMAYWAVHQHPYGRPDGLFDVTDAISEASKRWPDSCSSVCMWYVTGWVPIERWLRRVLEGNPVLAAWNAPRSGHTQRVMASSRYWKPKPENDFIDIDALLRNVAMSVWRSARD